MKTKLTLLAIVIVIGLFVGSGIVTSFQTMQTTHNNQLAMVIK